MAFFVFLISIIGLANLFCDFVFQLHEVIIDKRKKKLHFSLHGSWIVTFWIVFQVARGGHSATLVGSRLIIFGGEDRSRRLLNDVYALDLETMIWDVVETQ